MTISSVTYFGGDIAEGSAATPGLWDRRFSIISQNVDQINTEGTNRFADGTPLAPSIAFSSESSTGFYRAGAQFITMVAGGANRVHLTVAQGVGQVAGTATSAITPVFTSGARTEGIGFPTDDVVNVITANTERLRVDTSEVSVTGIPLRLDPGTQAAPTLTLSGDSLGFYGISTSRVGLASANLPVFEFQLDDGTSRLLASTTSTGDLAINFGNGVGSAGIGFPSSKASALVITNSELQGGFDNPATATHTALLLYDVDNATVERVTVGAADSGGVGFKLLRIPN